jgi:hypothetical protein
MLGLYSTIIPAATGTQPGNYTLMGKKSPAKAFYAEEGSNDNNRNFLFHQ